MLSMVERLRTPRRSAVSEVPERVLERIQKILRLANDAGATEAERDTAMRHVHANLAKYNLSLVEVESHQGKKPTLVQERKVDRAIFIVRPWARIICVGVADMCFS